MKAIKIFFFLGALIMTSCAKDVVNDPIDACAYTVCNNGGTCNDGTCICPEWFEGTNCNTEQRAEYYGVYIGEVEIYDNQGNVIFTDPLTVTVTPGANVNQLELDALEQTVPLTTPGSGNFSHSFQTIIIGQAYDYDVNGTFSGNLLEYYAYNEGILVYKFTGFK